MCVHDILLGFYVTEYLWNWNLVDIYKSLSIVQLHRIELHNTAKIHNNICKVTTLSHIHEIHYLPCHKTSRKNLFWYCNILSVLMLECSILSLPSRIAQCLPCKNCIIFWLLTWHCLWKSNSVKRSTRILKEYYKLLRKDLYLLCWSLIILLLIFFSLSSFMFITILSRPVMVLDNVRVIHRKCGMKSKFLFDYQIFFCMKWYVR